MQGEIKSEVDVAQMHVEEIKTANTDFASMDSVPADGLQTNKPTDAMRSVFSGAKTACANLSKHLGCDVENILLMAKEFELWDAQMGNADE